jgi:hypothetical protein
MMAKKVSKTKPGTVPKITSEEKDVFKAAFDDPSDAPSSTNAQTARPVTNKTGYDEWHARHLISIFEGLVRQRLASRKPALHSNDRARLIEVLAELSPWFDAFANSIEPFRTTAPARVYEAYRALHHLMDNCFDIGAAAEISRKDRERILHGRERGRITGAANKVRADEAWRKEYKQKAIEARSSNSIHRHLSQHLLANKIQDEWSGNRLPDHQQQVALIRQMEKDGELPPMQKGRSGIGS